MTDTTADARAAQIAAYRRMSPGARVMAAIEMSEQTVVISAAGIRARHPEYDEATIEWAVRRQRVGDDLFVEAWPGAPPVDP